MYRLFFVLLSTAEPNELLNMQTQDLTHVQIILRSFFTAEPNEPLNIQTQDSTHIQIISRSFIHCRAKRATKYCDLRHELLNIQTQDLTHVQIISRSFIHCRAKLATKYIDLGLNACTDYSSFFHPLPSQNEPLNIQTQDLRHVQIILRSFIHCRAKTSH